MPDELKTDAKGDPVADFIQKEIARTKHNLHCAINSLGHSALRAANPVPLIKRHPVKAGIVAVAALAGGALGIVYALRRKADAPCAQGPPVNVYVKKPKAQSKGWGQIGTALVAALTAKATQGIRTTITNSFSDSYQVPARPQPVMRPNTNLRDVEI
jgi:hypothetical protein